MVKSRIAFVLAALVVAFGGARAGSIEGRVIGVSDGDTITILDATRTQRKVRLSGIDAPEKRQPFGARAKQSLSSLAFGRPATVYGYKVDRYGRLAAKVAVDGMDVGLRQVQLGYAWHYKAYEREQSLSDRLAYRAAEEGARQSQIGLWGAPHPQPPWEFRRK